MSTSKFKKFMRRERVPTGSTDDYYTESHQRESSTASYTPSVTSTAQNSYSSGLGRSHSLLSKGTSRSGNSESTLQTSTSPRGTRNVGLGLESAGGKELDFEQLISSGETMKVTLTPNRLRTIEVDRNGSVKLEARNPYVKPTENITGPKASKSAPARSLPSSRNGYQQKEQADLEEYDSEDERMGYGPPTTEKAKPPAESLVDFLKNTGPNGSSVDVASLPNKYNPAPKSAQPPASIMKKPTSPSVRAVDTEPERLSHSSGRSRPLIESAGSPTRVVSPVSPEMTAPSQSRSQYNSRVAVPSPNTERPDMPPGPLPFFPVPPSRENSDSPSSNASPSLTSPRTPQASFPQYASAQSTNESSQTFPASSQEAEDDDYDPEFEQFLLPDGQVNKRRAPSGKKNGMPKQLGAEALAPAAAATVATAFNGQVPTPSKQMGGVGPRVRKPTIDTTDTGMANRSLSPSSPSSPGRSRKHAQQDLLDLLNSEPPPSVTQSPVIPFQLSNFPSPKVGSSPDSPNVNKRDTGIRKLMSRLRRDSVTSGGSRESEEHWDNARERQSSVVSVGSQKTPPMPRYEPASAGSAAILRNDNTVPRGTVPSVGPIVVTANNNEGQHSRQLSLADSNKDLPPPPKTPSAISNQSQEELREPSLTDRSTESSRRPSADSRTKEQRREHAAIGVGAGAATLGAVAAGLAVREAKTSTSSSEKIPIELAEPTENGAVPSMGTAPSTEASTATKDVAPSGEVANYIFGTSSVEQLVKAIKEATSAEQCQELVSQFMSAGKLEQQQSQPIKQVLAVPVPIDDEGSSEFGREAFEQGAVAEWLLGSWGAEAPKEDNDDVATIHPGDAQDSLDEPYTHGSEAYVDAAATEPASNGGLAEHEEILQESMVRKRDVPFTHTASEDRSTIYTMTTATEGFTDDELDERDFEDNDDYEEEGEQHMHQSAIDEALRAESRQSEVVQPSY